MLEKTSWPWPAGPSDAALRHGQAQAVRNDPPGAAAGPGAGEAQYFLETSLSKDNAQHPEREANGHGLDHGSLLRRAIHSSSRQAVLAPAALTLASLGKNHDPSGAPPSPPSSLAEHAAPPFPCPLGPKIDEGAPGAPNVAALQPRASPGARQTAGDPLIPAGVSDGRSSHPSSGRPGLVPHLTPADANPSIESSAPTDSVGRPEPNVPSALYKSDPDLTPPHDATVCVREAQPVRDVASAQAALDLLQEWQSYTVLSRAIRIVTRRGSPWVPRRLAASAPKLTVAPLPPTLESPGAREDASQAQSVLGGGRSKLPSDTASTSRLGMSRVVEGSDGRRDTLKLDEERPAAVRPPKRQLWTLVDLCGQELVVTAETGPLVVRADNVLICGGKIRAEDGTTAVEVVGKSVWLQGVKIETVERAAGAGAAGAGTGSASGVEGHALPGIAESASAGASFAEGSAPGPSEEQTVPLPMGLEGGGLLPRQVVLSMEMPATSAAGDVESLQQSVLRRRNNAGKRSGNAMHCPPPRRAHSIVSSGHGVLSECAEDAEAHLGAGWPAGRDTAPLQRSSVSSANPSSKHNAATGTCTAAFERKDSPPLIVVRGTAVLDSCTITGPHCSSGVLVTGEAARAQLLRSLVQGCGCSGVVVEAGARALLSHAALLDSKSGAGASVTGPGSLLVARSTYAWDNLTTGIEVTDGAKATLTRCCVASGAGRWQSVGVAVVGASADLRSCAVRGSRLSGLIARAGARVTALSCSFLGGLSSQQAGVTVCGRQGASTAWIEGCEIDGTTQFGVRGHQGAHITVVASHISNIMAARGTGLLVGGKDSTLRMVRCNVLRTARCGVNVVGGCAAQLTRVNIAQCPVGLELAGLNTRCRAVMVNVESATSSGIKVACEAGTLRARFVRCDVTKMTEVDAEAGLSVDGYGAEVVCTGCRLEELSCPGLVATQGACVELDRCEVAACDRTVGIVVAGEGAQLSMLTCSVARTERSCATVIGGGLLIAQDTSFCGSSCGSGLQVAGDGSRAALRRCSVKRCLEHGVAVAQGATANLEETSIAHVLRQAALLVEGHGTVAHLNGCELSHTGAAGILVTRQAHLTSKATALTHVLHGDGVLVAGRNSRALVQACRISQCPAGGGVRVTAGARAIVRDTGLLCLQDYALRADGADSGIRAERCTIMSVGGAPLVVTDQGALDAQGCLTDRADGDVLVRKRSSYGGGAGVRVSAAARISAAHASACDWHGRSVDGAMSEHVEVVRRESELESRQAATRSTASQHVFMLHANAFSTDNANSGAGPKEAVSLPYTEGGASSPAAQLARFQALTDSGTR
ncbi:unnamed protein product [Pedinophyceae sp. YPF-701]|nr:unnamed protein product [Pedinophyceae sp. YPF-701]